MKPHLFLFTLGPVQTFITQARKAHDLHSGSKLLSDLCRVACKEFEHEGGKVIFPEPSSESIPNRFLGEITTSKDLNEVGKNVADAVKLEWRNLFDLPQKDKQEALLSLLLDAPKKRAAHQQIENHLDIQWLFQEFEEANYQKAYEEINQRLNALKNTRPFAVFEETGRKCSLDGERNVIFYRKTIVQKDKKTDDDLRNGQPLFNEWVTLFEPEVKKGDQVLLRHLQPGEGLSAVSMLKRNLEFDAADFPSTAEFALAETMHQIGKPFLDEMTKLFEHDHPKHLNWQVFFEENLRDTYFKKQGLSITKLKRAIEIQADLQKTAAAAERSLNKYYALLLFDGDHMGEWWSGNRLKTECKPKLKEFHEKLAKKLAEYAHAVREEFEKDKHRGWVVYAGGDDFLGFFNLHYLASSVQLLRKKYQEIVHDGLKDYFDEPNKLTFSTGICIASYKEPLSLVLDEARDLEKKAKKLDEKTKDAFGIGVIPGSGQIARAIFKFEHFEGFEKMITDLKSNDFSNAFVSKARMELDDFKNEKGELLEGWNELSKRLLERSIGRACNLKKQEGESEEAFKKRKKTRINELTETVEKLLDSSEKLENFFDALDIADFIERQTKTPKNEKLAHETAN